MHVPLTSTCVTSIMTSKNSFGTRNFPIFLPCRIGWLPRLLAFSAKGGGCCKHVWCCRVCLAALAARLSILVFRIGTLLSGGLVSFILKKRMKRVNKKKEKERKHVNKKKEKERYHCQGLRGPTSIRTRLQSQITAYNAGGKRWLPPHCRSLPVPVLRLSN